MNQEKKSYKKSFFQSTIVSNILALCLLTIQLNSKKKQSLYEQIGNRIKNLEIDLSHCVIVVLLDDAFFTLIKFIDCVICPPGNSMAVFIVQVTFIIKTMYNLMSHKHSNA